VVLEEKNQSYPDLAPKYSCDRRLYVKEGLKVTLNHLSWNSSNWNASTWPPMQFGTGGGGGQIYCTIYKSNMFDQKYNLGFKMAS
jgi:hypothetical protein